LRKIAIGAACFAVLAMPASALAQNPAPVVTGDVKAAKHKLTFKVVNSAASKTTVKNIKLALPAGVKLDGKGMKSCKLSVLANEGPAGCASASKLGTGVAYAYLISSAPAPDCVATNGASTGCMTFDTTFFVGGPRVLNVFLQERGGSVQKWFSGKISADGRTLSIDIPSDLQQPLTGTYSALLQLSGTFNKGTFVTTTKTSGKAKSTLTYAANSAPAPAPVSVSDPVGK
jgi:hypothetical protein